jgi:hypothetical protein
MNQKQKRRLRKFSADGLPIDAREWTAADWRTLHEAVEKVKRDVAARHKPTPPPTPPAG